MTLCQVLVESVERVLFYLFILFLIYLKLARIVEKHGRSKKLTPILILFVGLGFIGCVEYRDPNDWMQCPSNIDFSVCWYPKRTNNK